MAIAFVATRLNANSAAVGTNIFLSPTTPHLMALGNMLILAIAVDNAGTAGVAPTTNVLDSRATPINNGFNGNVWRRQASFTQDPGAVNEGATIEIWSARIQFTYESADQLIVTFSPSTGRGAFVMREYSGVRNINSIADRATFGQNAATSALISIDPNAAGQLLFTAAAIETNVAVTGDADVTDGAWSAISNAVSNSGTAATSIALAVQHKIVTGGAVQNWAATWVGAADYASAGIIMDPNTAAAQTFPRGNPDYPCIAGFEGIGLQSKSIPLDSGSSYQFDHSIFPSHLGTVDYTVASEFMSATERVQHHVAYDLFPYGAETAIDEITTMVLPVSAVTLGADASVIGGGTALQALQAVGGTFLHFNASTAGTWPTPTAAPTAQVRFDASNLVATYPNARILRVGLRYIAWKAETADADPGEGFDVSWVDNLTPQTALYGSWLANDYRGDSKMQMRWLGEVNAASRDMGFYQGVLTSTSYWRAPFTVNDLAQMSLNETYVLFRAQPGYLPTQLRLGLDFVEMVVEIAPERRWAQGYRLVSNLGTVPTATFDYSRSILLTDPRTEGAQASLNLGLNWSLGVREALPPTPSDRYRADLFATTPKFTTLEAVGPSLQLKAAAQPRPSLEPQPEIWRVPLNHGILATNNYPDFDQYMTSVVAYDATSVGVDGPYFLGYQALAPESVMDIYFGMPLPRLQYVKVGAGATYDRIKLVVKPPVFSAATLTVSVELPLGVPYTTMTVTTAQVLSEGRYIGDGWYEISRPLAFGGTISWGTVEQVVLRFTSNVGLEDTFRVAAVTPTGAQGYFGYNYDPTQGGVGNPDPSIYDYAAVLQCVIDPPDLSISEFSFPLVRSATRCIDASTEVPLIDLNNCADYDRVVWERSIDEGATWQVIWVETDPCADPVFADFGVPWDIATIWYRATGYRDSDRRSASSTIVWAAAPATAPGAAFGLSVHDSSSEGLTLAYVPVDDRQLSVVWNPLNPVQYVPLHGKDFQAALRPAEERGLSVTVTVLVDWFQICASDDVPLIYEENLAAGDRAMSPKPYETLQLIASYPRATLQLPGGHTRDVSVELNTMTIRTAAGVYVAELTITDIAPFETDPYAGET